MFRTLTIAATLSATTAATTAGAEQIGFTDWTEQRIKLLSSNDYTQGEDTLTFVSDNTISLLWTRLPESLSDATTASWDWAVRQSVPPTDLSVKGGDDRNIAVYFLWVPEDVVPELEEAEIRSLIGRDDVRILQYVWGGNNPVGEPIPSPYGNPETGVTIPLRQADTGSESVTVDLIADFARAFGDREPGSLIGMAVSGDSDGTESLIEAEVSAVVVE
ncbi:DUF3047 domain-containing protein [Salipiger sp. IMCC34102]|uniref:DUF3047 domain-containing protein n=1 Tax=Salipiger sp. IMCC34102 TaxID=2510647 RepID=UPI00101D556F|nr:DUF3047 domain-containing protein [Salipiger sp. IMCC34102]RYH02303.1 DUF3047 domain-containing protein [Salipiger sp. IMCC34102]